MGEGTDIETKCQPKWQDSHRPVLAVGSWFPSGEAKGNSQTTKQTVPWDICSRAERGSWRPAPQPRAEEKVGT